MSPTAQEWKNSGLIPTSGLAAWHMYEAGASGHDIIFDYSGNGRTIENLLAGDPVLIAGADTLSGAPGWYFNGVNTSPLKWDGALTVNHVFILAAHEDAAFNLNRGLLSGVTVGDILTSDNAGTQFFDFGLANHSYRKSDVGYAITDQEAPMSNRAELMEIINSDGITLDGIQVGKQRNVVGGRIWKGFFYEQLIYTRILDAIERLRVMLYFNIKFAQWRRGLPFYFPSDDLMQFRRSRYDAIPLNYKETTEHFEFADKGRTFNEVADTPPRRWEYVYRKRTAAQTVIFDEFWNQARIVNPFIFRDKKGVEWADVQIEDYNRRHEAHKSFENDIEFRLVKYP